VRGVWWVVVLVLAGCAGPPRSTALTVDDLEATTQAMADKLSGSDLLRGRTAESEAMIVAIDKVQNLTSDLIPEGQQWWMMARVRDKLNVNALRRDRNVRFVIAKERLLRGMEEGNFEATTGKERSPTHAMSATFRSLTRSAGKDRTEAYACEYRITQIGSGELKWSDTFEFKRVAFGKGYD
jgi:hypothetical protein